MKAYEKYISKSVVGKIHSETLKILENVGVKFENSEALEIFKQHGIKCDGDIVFIKEEDVKNAVQTTPEKFELYSSKGKLKIGGGSRITMPVAVVVKIVGRFN